MPSGSCTLPDLEIRRKVLLELSKGSVDLEPLNDMSSERERVLSVLLWNGRSEHKIRGGVVATLHAAFFKRKHFTQMGKNVIKKEAHATHASGRELKCFCLGGTSC